MDYVKQTLEIDLLHCEDVLTLRQEELQHLQLEIIKTEQSIRITKEKIEQLKIALETHIDKSR